jgi:hypothetical protein
LGFSITYFGTSYSSVFVNNNGNVTFDAANAGFAPLALSGVKHDIVAPFYADVDTSAAGTVTYGPITYLGNPAFCVNWTGVGYFLDHGDKVNTFQLLLVSRADVGAGDFDIVMNYGTIAWETGDGNGGTGGLGGTSASVGYSNGTAATPTTFTLPGSGTPGSFLDINPTTGLIHYSNDGVPGQQVYPIRAGVPATPATTTSTATPATATSTGTPATATSTVTGTPVTGIGTSTSTPVPLGPPPPPCNCYAYPTSTPVPATSTATSGPTSPTSTATDTPVPPTATPTNTMIPIIVPVIPTATSTSSVPPVLQIHNKPRTVIGGRTADCDLAGNTNGALEGGCEIVSSVSAPGATVVYTLTFADKSQATFTDTADARGHSLHPFNVAFIPTTFRSVAYISVSATLPDGTKLGPVNTRFAVQQR